MEKILKNNIDMNSDMNKKQKEYPRILLSGDCAILVEFGDTISEKLYVQIINFVENLKKECENDIITDMIPAFCSVLIEYDAFLIDYYQMKEMIRKALLKQSDKRSGRTRIIEIPVCYGTTYGEDLDFVAENAGLTKEEVINMHSSRDYLIYMLGFMPGFPYLGGLDERLFTPRLSSPRIRIPAGSIGIGGKQTGIYPLESPGGWQLIGRTPIRPYRPDRKIPIIYQAGDYIRFIPIGEEEYKRIEREEENGQYQCKIISV